MIEMALVVILRLLVVYTLQDRITTNIIVIGERSVQTANKDLGSLVGQ